MTRNTCFILLMGLEEDLARALRVSIPGSEGVLTETECADALARYVKDKGGQAPVGRWSDLVDYLDLSVKLDLLARHRAAIASSLGLDPTVVSRVVATSKVLVPIRNRVCHARPLEEDDFPTVLDTMKDLLSDVPFPFDALAREYHLLRSNQYPFAIAIPDYWSADDSGIIHNLPPPDFDDTGFIGRDQDRQNLLNHLLGAHPVITVTGEGGIGKTALTVQCLYDIVDDSRLPYEVILFGSLKTNRLTGAGVVSIVNAAADETEVLGPLVRVFDAPPPDATREQLFDSVIHLMSGFRVLLAIDNIESIELAALRPLLTRIPRQSKVVLTSRIGLGEIEIRYPVDSMSIRDAVRLFRRLARIFNVQELSKRSDDQIADICLRLYYSPLLLRWFVEGYSDGRSVSELLNNPKTMSSVLDFCFDNVYRRFSELQRSLLQILVVVPGPMSEVQLALLAGIKDIDEVRVEIQYLYASNVVRRTAEANGHVGGNLWTPTDFARRYVNTKDNRPINERQKIMKAYRALIAARDDARLRARDQKFNQSVIDARSTDQATVVRILRNAQHESSLRNHDTALALVSEAMALQPEFHEVWRVSAQIKDQAGDFAGAYDDFQEALSRAGEDNEPLLVFCSQFLRKHQDFDGAREVLQARATSGTAAPEVIAEFAWLHVLLGQPAEAARLFGSVEAPMEALGGTVRTHYLTQYVCSLRRASEGELAKRNCSTAVRFGRRALELFANQVNQVVIDMNLVREGQKCFQLTARLLAETCDTALWQEVAPLLEKMGSAFPLMGEVQTGSMHLERQCPEITTTETYAAITGSKRAWPLPRPETRWRGLLKEVYVGREYGFIRGADGSDYFVHRSEFVGPGSWEDLWGKPPQPVEFSPGEQVAVDKAAKANAVKLLRAEE